MPMELYISAQPSFFGDAYGEAGDATSGEKFGPSQLLYGYKGTGKDGIGFIVGLRFKAFGGLLGKLLEGAEVQLTAAVPICLGGQSVSFVPIEGGGLFQFADGVFGHLYTKILGQRTGIVIQTEQSGIEEKDDTDRSDDPTKPLDRIPFPDDQHNKTCQHAGYKDQDSQLP